MRISKFAICLSVAVFFVSACGNTASDRGEADGSVLHDAPTRLMGKAHLGRDEAIIFLCEDRQTCGDALSFGELAERSCALELNKVVTDALLRRHGVDAAFSTGEFWIAGRGRRSKGIGGLGHLGGQQCQVRFDGVDSIDPGPPYIWMPLPPTN